MKISTWKKDFDLRKRYAVPSRLPFYDLARPYIGNDKESVVVDIGAGEGEFADHLHLSESSATVYLLDQNPETVEKLKKRYKHVELYVAPGALPFKDRSVSFLHLSHIVEHLAHQDLYAFLKEIDRVLKDGGIVMFSTPLLWDRFYDDMSHIKPYNPSVFINYLCKARENPSNLSISTAYQVEKLVFRYRSIEIGSGFGSRYFLIDSLIRVIKIALSLLGFRTYIKNGYTLVLQKTKA